jgi:toxin HigB-1
VPPRRHQRTALLAHIDICADCRKIYESRSVLRSIIALERRRKPAGRSFQAQAERKLQMLDSAKDLNDQRVPPGNRLEKLGGDRRGQHSIRINDQWRICFRWRDDGTWDVEIVDYH